MKLNQNMAVPVVPNLLGTFLISEADTPTRPCSQPASEPDAPERTPKLKSVVSKVCPDKAKPANLDGLGPAVRSRYNDTTKDDQMRRDKS